MLTGEHFTVELPGAKVVFTTRRGGCSTGPYESLNLGLHTDDDPAHVRTNLDTVAQRHGVRPVYGRQVHGARVALSAPDADGFAPDEADGRATAAPGVAPMVLTADCLAIAVSGGGSVAMLHAGWRGLAAGVIPAGVERVRELGSGGRLHAALGPRAGVCCYEVGEEVHEVFSGSTAQARSGRNLDLGAIARHQLREAGVSEIEDLGLCTMCSDPSLFYSHRRDRGVTGRQAGLAWLS